MAKLIYGSSASHEFDERTLAHLKIAITAKLRVRESFLLNWVVPSDRGSGRMSLWISPDVPLVFVFSDPRPPQLNRVWLDALSRSAHGIRGMTVMAEDEAEAYLKAAGAAAAP
ncbi:hypothetical protein ACFOYW_01875 [Gryllotalpicola reticulitermitis]|uniref:DUF7882 domain-containing protein n=1 Tax=Gryllotalpicola reticulitermitis TaxID=1184153 RepID=A0ABV8Q0V7_9MICO